MRVRRYWIAAATVGLMWSGAFVGRAVDVEIVKEGSVKTTIDISGLSTSGPQAETFKKTLKDDLVRSGWFIVTSPGAGLLVLEGRCEASGDRLSVPCRLTSRATHEPYVDKTFSGRGAEARGVAHEVADEIVRRVTGRQGIASTRIVMVGARGGKKDVYMCDADGYGLIRVTQDDSVCLSPAWTPKADGIVYTSFHRGYPDVYIIDLKSGKRTQLASFPGLNAGADVSPDGRRVALTLSKDGNPDLYSMTLRGRDIIRLTYSRRASEASPSWSPDGRQLVYVSDSAGSPNLYVLSASGGDPKRITYRGTENVAPDWGPDGRIAFCSRRSGQYVICIYDPETGRETTLAHDTADYEDPSWAPDGRHLVCTRTVRFASDLYVLDSVEDPPLRLLRIDGNWHSASWSPR